MTQVIDKILRDGQVFKYFEDERRFEMPRILNANLPDSWLPENAARYELSDGTVFWLDRLGHQVRTTDPDLSLFWFYTSEWSNNSVEYEILLEIDSRRFLLTFSQDSDDSKVKYKNDAGNLVFELVSLTEQFLIDTRNYDIQYRVSRPENQKNQILTNSTTFQSVEQQNRALEFLQTAFAKLGIFNSVPRPNNAKGILEFSNSLQKQIGNGDLLDG